MITDVTPKQDAITQAFTSFATVFAKMINTPSSSQPAGATSSTEGLSPCRAADLRMKRGTASMPSTAEGRQHNF